MKYLLLVTLFLTLNFLAVHAFVPLKKIPTTDRPSTQSDYDSNWWRTNLFGQKNLDKRSNSNCGRRYDYCSNRYECCGTRSICNDYGRCDIIS
ncbi:hypothetical protein EB796_004000 [Bugula neritina]|uniref:Uncharacterized protein n=1 Tax=Bugula neritina TaxID=10212 RepID=A0A7J7KG99_BUGNE|nr:hypothetical protein EB796_004000 [Bugula neritina]